MPSVMVLYLLGVSVFLASAFCYFVLRADLLECLLRVLFISFILEFIS